MSISCQQLVRKYKSRLARDIPQNRKNNSGISPKSFHRLLLGHSLAAATGCRGICRISVVTCDMCYTPPPPLPHSVEGAIRMCPFRHVLPGVCPSGAVVCCTAACVYCDLHCISHSLVNSELSFFLPDFSLGSCSWRTTTCSRPTCRG